MLMSNTYKKQNELLSKHLENIEENYLLKCEENKTICVLYDQLVQLLSARNRQINQLQRQIRVLKRRSRRVLINHHGQRMTYERDNDGVYQPLQRDEETTESEEEPEAIARRLFSDYDSDTSDVDLLDRLMGNISD